MKMDRPKGSNMSKMSYAIGDEGSRSPEVRTMDGFAKEEAKRKRNIAIKMSVLSAYLDPMHLSTFALFRR